MNVNHTKCDTATYLGGQTKVGRKESVASGGSVLWLNPMDKGAVLEKASAGWRQEVSEGPDHEEERGKEYREERVEDGRPGSKAACCRHREH